ncbi:MAG: hypothetical protein ABIR91_00785 [Candidatus Saccharimonadales bacterium]
MSERLNTSSFEQNQVPEPTIDQLLPRYYETHPNWRFESLQTYDIDGHEAAWMKVTSTDRDDQYEGREFKCACDFTEDVGWAVHEQFGVVGKIGSQDNCQPRRDVSNQRKTELLGEYSEQFANDADIQSKSDFIRYVMLDLIAKEKTGAFIGETSNGAQFWGGYFYLQTVREIINAADEQDESCSWTEIWAVVDEMCLSKQIQLEGMVVQEYYEPPAPAWDTYGTIEYKGYTGVMKLPAHGHMSATWQFDIVDANGKYVVKEQNGLQLTHEPVFGPDVDDVYSVEQTIREAIDRLMGE